MRSTARHRARHRPPIVGLNHPVCFAVAVLFEFWAVVALFLHLGHQAGASL